MKLFLFCAALFAALPARADAPAQMLRALSAKYGTASVTLSVVLKSNASDEQTEVEASGVILDASGLLVTTNSAIDPYSMRASDTSGIVTNVVGAKYLMPDGTQIPARVVLRDKDLNLAFARPLKTPAKPLATLDFRGAGARLQNGDPVFLLGRLGKAGGRVASVEVGRVLGVLDKPRRLYALPTTMLFHMGDAAFSETGQLIGLVSLRAATTRGSSFSQGDSYLAAIVPAADVWEVARQAPAIKNVPAPKKPR